MFVIVDTDEDDHRRVIEFLGLKEEKMPTMRIIQMQEDVIKYKPESTEIEEENIKNFVTDYVAGKVPINYLTEKLPEDWDSTPVKVSCNGIGSEEEGDMHPSIFKGGVVAYPVMQVYGSLALEANSEVGEAVVGRCSISCVCNSAF